MDSVYILGGLQPSQNGMNSGFLYSDFARPKKVKLTFSSATTTLYSAILNVPDNASGTIVSLPNPILITSPDTWAQTDASVEILDTYTGQEWENVALSEFNLLSYPTNTFANGKLPKIFTITGQPLDSNVEATPASENQNPIIVPNNPSLPISTKPQHSKLWWIILPAVLIILAILGVWQWRMKKKSNNPTKTDVVN